MGKGHFWAQQRARKWPSLVFLVVGAILQMWVTSSYIQIWLWPGLFANFLSCFAVKYVQQLEEISKSSKYCLGYIFKGQKVLNDRMKLENNKATPSWKFSTQEEGTGTSNCLVITKRLKNKRETNRLISDLLLQLLVLVKFSLFCVVVFFWRSDVVWWTGDQLALLYSVFICSSFTSFWVIPYKS